LTPEDHPGALGTVRQMLARGAGVGDHQIERCLPVDLGDPGGHRRAVGHVYGLLAHACA
jgi:hypothetical protein